MPFKTKNEKGEEVEVYTKEELEAAERKGKEDITKELEGKHATVIKEKEDKLKTLTTDLESAKEALETAGQGTKDWAEARKTIKTLEGKIEEVSKARDEDNKKFGEDLRNVRTATFKSTVDGWFDSLSGGDAEVKKKLEFHYGRLGKDVVDEKGAMEVMKDAHLLATGKQAPNMFNVARGFSGEAPKPREQASAEVAELGKKFGISDADITKYSAKVAEKKATTNN